MPCDAVMTDLNRSVLPPGFCMDASGDILRSDGSYVPPAELARMLRERTAVSAGLDLTAWLKRDNNMLIAAGAAALLLILVMRR